VKVANACAGPFGAVYDFYVERPRLMLVISRLIWGIDASLLYDSMEPIGRLDDGATILDVPSGGGVAMRALRPEQDIRYVAVDLSEKMLARARRRAAARSLQQVEFLAADMTDLPFADETADLFLSFSGLHMVPNPERAIAEIARCLKPGGRVIGTTFVSDVSLRARTLFAIGSHSGHATPPARADLERWLRSSGIEQLTIGPQRGFLAFAGMKPSSAS
jgi:ubiquinone/menaquinone biosynthesis C-methylase UbiE